MFLLWVSNLTWYPPLCLISLFCSHFECCAWLTNLRERFFQCALTFCLFRMDLKTNNGSDFSANTCVICKLEFDENAPANILRNKGFETLIQVSQEHDRPDLHDCLLQMKDSNQEVKVHHKCRRKFTDARKKTSEQPPTKSLRSSIESKFDWKIHCVFCGKVIDIKHQSYHEVMTLDFHRKIAARQKKEMMSGERKCYFSDLVRGS